jgi:hypothetical protein
LRFRGGGVSADNNHMIYAGSKLQIEAKREAFILGRAARDVLRAAHSLMEDLTSTQVDRDILEKLDGPLGHLLRNAVDIGFSKNEVASKITFIIRK